MLNQLLYLLRQWAKQPDTVNWVLGTIYKTEGPAYRKAGAMMLFNSLGQQWGMLSGGCLETDIQTHARQVMQSGKAAHLCYDGSDEDDLSFQLGIGCGGKVYIILQPIHADNHYLQLDKVLDALSKRQAGIYRQNVSEPDQESFFSAFFSDFSSTYSSRGNRPSAEDELSSENDSENITDSGLKTQLITEGEHQYLQNVIRPQPHLLVIGGGVDARPVVGLGHQLGWRISLWDPRPANARREYFMDADQILSGSIEDLPDYVQRNQVDAAILMSHNLELDAQAVQYLNQKKLKYWALLGPTSRRLRVVQQAGLEETQLVPALAGPAGLDIGAELPESIALAILAECHSALNAASGRSLSDYLAC